MLAQKLSASSDKDILPLHSVVVWKGVKSWGTVLYICHLVGWNFSKTQLRPQLSAEQNTYKALVWQTENSLQLLLAVRLVVQGAVPGGASNILET